MANNYRQFAFVLKLKNEKAAKWFEETLTKAGSEEDEDGCTKTDFDWSIGREGGFSVFFKDNGESGNVDQIADFVEEYLKKFEISGHFRMTWADFCDKHRPGEFGGGLAVITAKGQSWLSENNWVTETLGKENLEGLNED